MSATPAEEAPPEMREAPAQARRGRKPKVAGTSFRALAADDSCNTDAGIPEAAVANAEASDRPVRGRPGRKPQRSAGAMAASLLQNDAKPAPGKRGRKPPQAGLATEPTPSTDDASSLTTTTRSKSAAYWDRATDTARFDWPEIERTASQDGPNQGMAKLLIAARAEGANSRWPL